MSSPLETPLVLDFCHGLATQFRVSCNQGVRA